MDKDQILDLLNPTEYRYDFAIRLIEHGREGRVLETFGPRLAQYAEDNGWLPIKVTSMQVKQWLKEQETFALAYQYYKDELANFWERQSIINLCNPKYNTSLYLANMKFKFNWHDAALAPIAEDQSYELKDIKQLTQEELHQVLDSLTQC